MYLPQPRSRPATAALASGAAGSSFSAITVKEVLYPLPLKSQRNGGGEADPLLLFDRRGNRSPAVPSLHGQAHRKQRPGTATTATTATAAAAGGMRSVLGSCFPEVPRLRAASERPECVSSNSGGRGALLPDQSPAPQRDGRPFLVRAKSYEEERAQVEEMEAFSGAEAEYQRQHREDDDGDEEKAAPGGDDAKSQPEPGPERNQYIALLTQEEKRTFISERLFSEVLVKGSVYRTNPLLVRIVHVSAVATLLQSEGESKKKRSNPLVAAMRSVTKRHGLRSISLGVFPPLMTAAFTLFEARQEDARRRRREETKRKRSSIGGFRGERFGNRKRRSTTRASTLLGPLGEGSCSAGSVLSQSAVQLVMPDAEQAMVDVERSSHFNSCPADTSKIVDADYSYLYRFLDWEAYGSVETSVFLSRLELLMQPLFIVQSAVFVYTVFYKNTRRSAKTAGSEHGAFGYASPFVHEERPKTDLFKHQNERLSLAHQQLLLSVMEIEKMLESVVESYQFIREEELERERRAQEQRRATAEAERVANVIAHRRSGSVSLNSDEANEDVSSTSIVVALPEKRKLSMLAKRKREEKRKLQEARATARAQQRREETYTTMEAILKPACKTVVSQCVAVHDGKFRVTVGQLRRFLFQEPQLISLLGEIVDLYLSC